MKRRLVVAAALIWLILILPPEPMPLAATLLRFPTELLAILAFLCLFRNSARVIVTLALFLLTLAKLADLAMHHALGRPFNLIADLPLIDAAIRLIRGSIGPVGAILAVSGVILAVIAILMIAIWASGVWSRQDWPKGVRIAAASLLALIVIAVPAFDLRLPNFAYAEARLELSRKTLADIRQLRLAAEQDPYAGRSDLLNAIDRDLIIIFVESYGRASFDVAFYAKTHLATLLKAQSQLAASGLSMRSGFVTAPTQGGQSWLSHATLANGLGIKDQTGYQALLASHRQSLFHHAARAGFATAAIMPAITRPWPDAQRMGFQQVLAAKDLDYRGPPFNWVTMPDQFTLSRAEELLGRTSGQGRHALQIVLISSHAPWTPVPRMLPWDQIGDGQVFQRMARSGQTPREVWADPEKLQDHYRGSVDYALQAAFGFALRQSHDAPLIFLLGDHQAAPGIALDDNQDVALHVIGPEALVNRVADWGFTPGLIPAPDSAALPMDHLRDMILSSFTDAKGPS